ncbi:MAG: DEAD/DEAH box helicase family protein [Oscillospiraceae bacterium]|nr:DEAD/DEAH box helicase family protein [Oscillospiraceae bacterium]
MLYPHNQKTYDQICSYFDNGTNNICLVQGMGTGKSFIFMELANSYFKEKKILYVVPKMTIESNLKKYEEFINIDDHVAFCTYNTFKNDEAVEKALSEYDLFVIDEAHHLGSDIYGNYLCRLLEKVKQQKNRTYFAMTATPIRSNDKKDVSHYFDQKVTGISTIEAIQNGLMPQVEYLICSSQISKLDRERYNIKIDYENSIDLLQQIIKGNPRKRWLCYYSTIKGLKNNRSVVKSLFPDHRIIEISSDTEHSQNAIDNILDDEKVVICSVDKLLEGIHLPNMQGILLFRKVHSLTVFTQIFGRITAIGETEIPLFVDCTNTGTRMLSKLVGLKEAPKEILKEKTKASRPVLYTSLNNRKYFDISVLLMSISEYNKWTQEEDDILRKYYLHEGKEITKRIINHSYSAIVTRAGRLGLFINKQWTEQEDQVLKEYYLTEKADIVKRLPGRTVQAVERRARILGLYKENRGWASWEDDLIRKHYPEYGPNMFHMLDKRTKNAAKRRASVLGIKYGKQKEKWTEEEDSLLKKYYFDKSANISKLLPDRSKQSITYRASYLGITRFRRWSNEEIEILKEFYPVEGKNVVNRLPGRSEQTIKAKVSELSIRKARKTT